MKAATKTKIKIKQPARKYWFVQFWILGELLLLLYSCLRTSNLIKVKCILSCKFAIRLFGGCGFYPGGSRRCHSETLNVKGMPLHGWAIFAPERMLACITSNNLSVLVFLLTNLLFGIPLSLDQFLNTVWLFGTMAWGNIRQKRLRWFRGELVALFIQWQCLCHTELRCSMLSFRLFQIGATNSAPIFSANCSIRLIAFIICCHPLLTLKSPLSLEEQPLILNPVTVLTATNLNSSRHLKIPVGLCHFPWFIVFFSSLCIAFHFLYCIVLLYSALLFV